LTTYVKGRGCGDGTGLLTKDTVRKLRQLLLGLLISLAFPGAALALTTKPAQPWTLLGAGKEGSDFQRQAGGRAQALQVKASASGVARSIRIHIFRANNRSALRVVLYDSSRQCPSSPVSQGLLGHPRAGTWSTASIHATRLTTAKTYWVALLPRSGSDHLRTAPTCRTRNVPARAIASVGHRQIGSRCDSICAGSVYIFGTAPSGGASHPASAPAPAVSTCSSTVTSLSAVVQETASASAGSVICLAPGTYTGTLLLGATRTADVTIQADGVTVSAVEFAASAAHLHLAGITVPGAVNIDPGASFITLANSTIRGGIYVDWGAHDLTISHNYLDGGHFGVWLDSENCAVSFGPANCSTVSVLPTISNVLIEGNKFQGPFGDDAININNYQNVTITGNEITGVVENGQHDEVLQSTWGGSGLTFTDNYVHDICGQGFFIKDGLVSNVVFDNNLFVRWLTCPHAPQGELAFDVFDVHGMQMVHNTFVSGAEMLQAYNPSAPESTGIVMQDNVLDDFLVENPDPGAWDNPTIFSESRNVIFDGWDWEGLGLQAASDATSAPTYVNPSQNDYRVASPVTAGGQSYTPGIDWQPANQSYGPMTTS
jgi:hypothetical protein